MSRLRSHYLRAVWCVASLGALWVLSNVSLGYPRVHDWRIHHDPVCVSREWVPDLRVGSPTYGTPVCKVAKR